MGERVQILTPHVLQLLQVQVLQKEVGVLARMRLWLELVSAVLVGPGGVAAGARVGSSAVTGDAVSRNAVTSSSN